MNSMIHECQECGGWFDTHEDMVSYLHKCKSKYQHINISIEKIQ
jgi:predicted  nucleic acid-binding Zn-ribbon protein